VRVDDPSRPRRTALAHPGEPAADEMPDGEAPNTARGFAGVDLAAVWRDWCAGQHAAAARQGPAARFAPAEAARPMAQAEPMLGLARSLADYYAGQPAAWVDLKRCLPGPPSAGSAVIDLYLDTEFTALPVPGGVDDADLISLGLTTGDRFFYGVNADADLSRASPFVLRGKGEEEGILSIALRAGDVPVGRAELARRLAAWLDSLPAGASLRLHYDFATDWRLFCTLFRQQDPAAGSIGLDRHALSAVKLNGLDIAEEDLARYRHANDDPACALVRHHALHDARSLAYAHAVKMQRRLMPMGRKHAFQAPAPPRIPHRLLQRLEAFVGTAGDRTAQAHAVGQLVRHVDARILPAAAGPAQS
jgi:hypothetical protein